ncbi:MAG: tetrahydrodipicolinate succinyltransferase, partial [Paraglaciecola sp.]
MTITRNGHRYLDVESGKTLDVWFPRSNKYISRNCLASKVGLIKGEYVEITIDIDAKPESAEDAYLR